ncbi:MAG: hypothetical protein FWE74_02270 [Oscillospiraceae bacterium]|nr:hypothetical protein [Oscillospiraceae bacterium]
MKKLCTLIAVVAALAMLGTSALALTLDGTNVIVDTAGDYDGVLVLEMDGLELTRDPRSPGGALVVYNAENGKIVIAGIGLEAGDELIALSFSGEGTFTLTAEDGAFGGASFNGTVGSPVDPGSDLEDPTVDPGEEDPGEEDPADDINPKGGVALAIVPAIVAAAAVAVTRKRK